MTVSDLDRSVEFYSKVLSFEKVSEVKRRARIRTPGRVFRPSMRVARMRLGDEFIELTEYLAPRGKPALLGRPCQTITGSSTSPSSPADMDRAYKLLRANRVEHASTGPQLLPEWNRNAAGIQAFYFRDPDGHFWKCCSFPSDKGLANGIRPTDCFWE